MTLEHALATVKEGSKIVALLAATGTCLMATEMIFEIGHNEASLQALVDKRMDAEFVKLNIAVQVPLTGLTADLGELHKTLFTANVSAMEVGKTAMAESALMQKINPKIVALVDDFGNTVESANGTAKAATKTLDATTETIKAAQPVLASTNLFVTQLNESTPKLFLGASTFIDNANALATDKSIPQIMSNVASMTASGVGIMDTTDKVEKKITQCTLHPTLLCYAKSNILFGAQVGGYLLR